MRVNGDLSPDSVMVEKSVVPGMVEVRVRENAKEFTDNEGNTSWEYDEYTFSVPDEEGLKEKILANLSDWVLTGKNMELHPATTLYVTAKQDAIDEFTEQLINEGVF